MIEKEERVVGSGIIPALSTWIPMPPVLPLSICLASYIPPSIITLYHVAM